MERKSERISLAQVVASPVLTGTNDKYVWTGLVKSEKIDSNMIPDDKSREFFIKKVRDVEQSVARYKNILRGTNRILQLKSEETTQDVEQYILKICKEIKGYLNKPDSIGLDLDLFWVELCREYEEIRQKNPSEFLAMNPEARKSLETFREYVNKNEAPIREIYVPEQNKYVCVQFLTHGQENRLQRNNRSNTEALLSVIENIAGKKDVSSAEGVEIIKELAGPITLADLPIIFPSKKFADMQYITVFKNYLLGKGFSYEDIEKMTIDDIVDEAMKTYNLGNFEFHSSLVADTIVSGINYLDIEKVMMLAAIRPLEAYELMSPKVQKTDPTEAKIIQLLSEKEEEGLERLENFNVEENQLGEAIAKTRRTEYIIKRILETNVIGKRTRFKINSGESEIEVSQKRIEELMQNFCDGIYLSETMQLALVFEAYNDENSMSESWSDELVKRIHLSDNDMYVLSTVNFENLKRLYSLGRMNKEHIKNLLAEVYSGALDENIDVTFGNGNTQKRELMKQNNRNLLKNLYDAQIINEKDLAEYFELGFITIENLNTIEEGKAPEELFSIHEELKKEFTQDKMLEKYKQYITKYVEFKNYQKQHPEETEKIESLREEVNALRAEKEKYRQVFKKYNSILENEKISFGDDLLAQYYVEFEVTDEERLQETIKALYEDGFIDLENIVHFDKNYIIPMLDRLSLDDANKVRNSMTFEELEDMLDDIFDNPEFSDERKFIIVMNLLGEDTEEDKNAREFYLEMLDFNNNERRAKTQGRRKIKNHGVGNDSTKYVYPDVIKWKFYKALDKDVRVTRYSNGFVEFASSKLGVRIIEKYYDGNKPAYGTATYILSEDDYRKNEADLITILPKGNILESATLREIVPRKDRIAHRTQSKKKTWMDEVIKYFDIDVEAGKDTIKYFDIDVEAGKDTRYTGEELMYLDTVRNNHKFDYEIID